MSCSLNELDQENFMMKIIHFKAILFTIALAFCSSSQAGDAEVGKQKSITCAACHGAEGISPVPSQPHLAGQVPGYIASQLEAYKTGERINAIMAGMVAALSSEDMEDLDAYYSSLKPAIGSISETQVELASEGEQIYKGGVNDRQIASCTSCHGTSGKGVPKLFPSVAGQHAEYLETQLLAFKKGERKGYNNMMHDIAFGLTEQQIKALAIYMSGLN